jgi:site-specific DNA-methyltransferase (adenine-specific)
VLARKPLSEPTVAANVLRWGVGALNVDGCRVGSDKMGGYTVRSSLGRRTSEGGEHKDFTATSAQGRWPPNTLFSHLPDCAADCGDECGEGCAVAELGRQSGVSVSKDGGKSGTTFSAGVRGQPRSDARKGHTDTGTAARFFPCFRYCAKASRKDRGEGNTHPTVKPTALMQWLVRLVTPPQGVVLDPFAGSGTTLVACQREGFGCVGVEMDEGHCEIARRRVNQEAS